MVNLPTIAGIHHVTLPVSDLARSAEWYANAVGFEPCVELEEEDRVIAVLLRHPCGAELKLCLDAPRAAALAGFDVLTLAVDGRAELDLAVSTWRGNGVEVAGPFAAHLGWAARITDPDGIGVRLHTMEPFDEVEQ